MKSFDAVAEEIRSATGAMRDLVDRVIAINETYTLRARQAEWHVRGLAYHCEALLRRYQEFARGVAGRAGAVMENGGKPPAMLIMYSTECQQMMFEFYALVNLARISLDRLVHVVSPVFKTPVKQLPNSITDFVKGRTDCPLFQALEREPIVPYLIDVRDCLIHFRSFGTHDNALVLLEGEIEPECISGFTDSFFRAEFRPVGAQTASVNVLLPDKIFVRDENGKKLVPFTYKERINLLTQSKEFLRMAAVSTAAALALLIEPGKPTYTYSVPKHSSR